MRQQQKTIPGLIAEIVFIEWTSDRAIRHPSFQGLREDKSPKEVMREIASAPSRTSNRVVFST
jgi:bifunctional non-homologous end joining protein LigD